MIPADLQTYFRDGSPLAIAVSGGVDSMTLAVVAGRAKPASRIYHAISPAVPAEATQRVKEYAAREHWHLNIIDAGEMRDADYLANPANRCYFCKTRLYDAVARHTSLGVAAGTNLDDLDDYRPGLIAAEEHQVRHPYVDLGYDKRAVRQVAATLGLADLQDLPASPCLSSRVTTGIAIDAKLLPVIDEVERAIGALLRPHVQLEGIRCRVREGETALQLETPEADFDRPIYRQAVDLTRRILLAQGYASRAVNVVVEPYRKGSAFLIESREVS